AGAPRPGWRGGRRVPPRGRADQEHPRTHRAAAARRRVQCPQATRLRGGDMAAGPGQAVLGWVAGVLGTGRPEVVRGLRDGASPWLLRVGGREVVLRVGRPAIAHELATEAAALELAAAVGVAVP